MPPGRAHLAAQGPTCSPVFGGAVGGRHGGWLGDKGSMEFSVRLFYFFKLAFPAVPLLGLYPKELETGGQANLPLRVPRSFRRGQPACPSGPGGETGRGLCVRWCGIQP